MMNEMRMKIVLAADRRYAEQVMTTIKSICYFNKHIDFYLLNTDFLPEWLKLLGQQLKRLDCTLYDVKVDPTQTKQFLTYSHISSQTTYFRYYIGEILPHGKSLYLDSDLIVTGNLNQFYHLELDQYFIAAVKDPIAERIHHRCNEFNAGVMLINNTKWNQEKVCMKALQLTQQYMQNKCLVDGDQQILNELFTGNWLQLPYLYNYQTGFEYLSHKFGKPAMLELEEGTDAPLIVHYSTEAKPWLNFQVRYSELYWHYHQMSWDEIVANSQ